VHRAARARTTGRTTVNGTDIYDTDIVCKGVVIGSLALSAALA
jgi:hypothetical protein